MTVNQTAAREQVATSRLALLKPKHAHNGFDPEAFLATAGLGRTLAKLKTKQVLFSQGEPADAIFYIQKGRMKLTVVSKRGKEATIAMLGAGEFIGESCIAAA